MSSAALHRLTQRCCRAVAIWNLRVHGAQTNNVQQHGPAKGSPTGGVYNSYTSVRTQELRSRCCGGSAVSLASRSSPTMRISSRLVDQTAAWTTTCIDDVSASLISQQQLPYPIVVSTISSRTAKCGLNHQSELKTDDGSHWLEALWRQLWPCGAPTLSSSRRQTELSPPLAATCPRTKHDHHDFPPPALSPSRGGGGGRARTLCARRHPSSRASTRQISTLLARRFGKRRRWAPHGRRPRLALLSPIDGLKHPQSPQRPPLKPALCVSLPGCRHCKGGGGGGGGRRFLMKAAAPHGSPRSAALPLAGTRRRFAHHFTTSPYLSVSLYLNLSPQRRPCRRLRSPRHHREVAAISKSRRKRGRPSRLSNSSRSVHFTISSLAAEVVTDGSDTTSLLQTFFATLPCSPVQTLQLHHITLFSPTKVLVGSPESSIIITAMWSRRLHDPTVEPEAFCHCFKADSGGAAISDI